MNAQGWDDRYRDSEFVWSMGPNATVQKYLHGLAPGSALDLGAGECRNAVWLASQGWNVTAVDFSRIGLDKGRKLAANKGVDVTFVLADVETFDMGTRAWDLVLVSYLQIPNTQRLDVLERAAEAVAPDGLLMVIAHDRSNVSDGWGGPPDEEVCYTVEETVSVLRGFDVQIAGIIEREVDTESGPRVALDTLVVAHRATTGIS